MSDDSVIEALCETEFVFIGRAVAVLEVRPTITEHKIVPLRTFKGSPRNPTITLSETNCDWYFRPGMDYLIFANHEKNVDYLLPTACGLTVPAVAGEKIIGILAESAGRLDEMCGEPASSERKARLRLERVSGGEAFEELVEETRRQLSEN